MTRWDEENEHTNEVGASGIVDATGGWSSPAGLTLCRRRGRGCNEGGEEESGEGNEECGLHLVGLVL